jgi:hypothetical protein
VLQIIAVGTALHTYHNILKRYAARVAAPLAHVDLLLTDLRLTQNTKPVVKLGVGTSHGDAWCVSFDDKASESLALLLGWVCLSHDEVPE